MVKRTIVASIAGVVAVLLVWALSTACDAANSAVWDHPHHPHRQSNSVRLTGYQAHEVGVSWVRLMNGCTKLHTADQARHCWRVGNALERQALVNDRVPRALADHYAPRSAPFDIIVHRVHPPAGLILHRWSPNLVRALNVQGPCAIGRDHGGTTWLVCRHHWGSTS